MGEFDLFGRQLSGLIDLGTIALLYFIVKRVYKPKVALLAALFSALAVMQIQESHYFTTDNFAVFFMFLATFFAVEISVSREKEPSEVKENYFLRLFKDRIFWLSAIFGLTLGMAVASKLNAFPLAVLLPVALGVRYFRNRRKPAAEADQPAEPQQPWLEDFLLKNLGFLIVGGIVAILSFRVFQPYAFVGLHLNPKWLANLRELRAQATPNANLDWALQWARRNNLYSFQNLTVWGLGLPLGILAWSGFLWMAWRMLRGEWLNHFLLWSWTAGYFIWQSLQYNPTMRYQLPIYPLLAMMAAWLVFWLWDKGKAAIDRPRLAAVLRPVSVIVGVVVLALTAGWAYAFLSVYTRPETRVAASNWIFQNVAGPINLHIQTDDGNSTYQQPLPFPAGNVIPADTPYNAAFVAQADGLLSQIFIPYAKAQNEFSQSGAVTLSLTLATAPDVTPEQVLARATATVDLTQTTDIRGNPVTLTLDKPVSISKKSTYYLQFQAGGEALSLSGETFANETDLDWSLPFRIGGYDPFGGIYRGDLNLQVYWDDNADKLARFQNVLDQADYILIPTNHQYGQITRIPERFPLTTVYYRELLGCPPEKNIIWCYRVAEPGMFKGSLGFELVKTFESYPTIGPLVINDQAAEEAFTFYDHPKVMVFKKTADYSPEKIQAILGVVDTSMAIHLTPGMADRYKSMMLPADQLAAQQEGGTWSELFNRNSLYNRYPVLGLILWYVVILLLGWITYPLVRAALPGLADRGYPLARIAGLLLWAWFAWLAGSLGLTYSRLTIAVSLGLVIIIGIWQARRQRVELRDEIRLQWKYFLMVEGLFLGFFLVDLIIRLGNPDLWHPAKGGERPMDFAYLNAILKSTSFPPYDPWFAGGYINYYYYGYVIVGTPVKLLGIVPSIAYNFILPTLFACLGMAAFSVGWNLLAGIKERRMTSARGGR